MNCIVPAPYSWRAEITGPRLLYRLRQAEEWLERVLGQVLSDQAPHAAGGFRLRVVDATVLNGPGQKAVQWHAYVSVDPSTGGIRAVELTDDSGGEKFSRHDFRAHEVVLGDRAYATARGLISSRSSAAVSGGLRIPKSSMISSGSAVYVVHFVWQ